MRQSTVELSQERVFLNRLINTKPSKVRGRNMWGNLIKFLNRRKVFFLWRDEMEDISDKGKENMARIPTQNPYGLIGMVLGEIAFILGPQYGFIPVIVLVFCIITLFTFDKEKEDTRIPFYLGIVLALIGLSMFIGGARHILN